MQTLAKVEGNQLQGLSHFLFLPPFLTSTAEILQILCRTLLAQSAEERNSPLPSFLMCTPPHKNIVEGSDTEAYAGRAHLGGRYVI